MITGAGGGSLKAISHTVAPKSFPQIDGELQMNGLNAAMVDIYRDNMGIPHVRLHKPRSFLHARICPCYGPLLADGHLAAHRRWTRR